MQSQVEQVVNGRNRSRTIGSESPHVDCVLAVDMLAAKRVRRAKIVPQKTRKYPGFSKERGKRQGVADVGWLSVSSLECGFLADRIADHVLKVRQDTCVIPASGGIWSILYSR